MQPRRLLALGPNELPSDWTRDGSYYWDSTSADLCGDDYEETDDSPFEEVTEDMVSHWTAPCGDSQSIGGTEHRILFQGRELRSIRGTDDAITLWLLLVSLSRHLQLEKG